MTESEMKFRDTTIRNFFDKRGSFKIDSRSKEEKTSIVGAFNKQVKCWKSIYRKRN